MFSFLERNNWIAWIFVIIFGSLIFYFSSLKYDPVPQIGYSFKTVLYHILIFFLFTFFLMVASSRGKNLDWIFFSVLFAFFYGVTDEFHQLYVSGRHASLGDVGFDFIGIVFAFLVYWIRIEVGKKIRINPNKI
jgi:VanZ family protein